MKEKTETDWLKATGHQPINDDLERANCDKAGQSGHASCGWCDASNHPRMMGGMCKLTTLRPFTEFCKPCRLAAWKGWASYRAGLVADGRDAWFPCENFFEWLRDNY